MMERMIMPWDLTHALTRSSSCRLQENARWSVTGRAEDGEELRMVVELQANVVVVTLFWPDEE